MDRASEFSLRFLQVQPYDAGCQRIPDAELRGMVSLKRSLLPGGRHE